MEEAGGKRIRTKPDTWAPDLDEGPQCGVREYRKRQAVEAPAALEPDDGLIPVETFLAEVLVAVHSLIQARAQLCLRKPVPPLSELGARTPGSSGATCILDDAVGALLTTIHAVASLPQTGAAPDDGVHARWDVSEGGNASILRTYYRRAGRKRRAPQHWQQQALHRSPVTTCSDY